MDAQVSDRSKPVMTGAPHQPGRDFSGLEERMAALEGQIAELIRLQKQQLSSRE